MSTNPIYAPTQASLARLLLESGACSNMAQARKVVSRAVKAGEVREEELKTTVENPWKYEDATFYHTWLVAPAEWVESKKQGG